MNIEGVKQSPKPFDLSVRGGGGVVLPPSHAAGHAISRPSRARPKAIVVDHNGPT